MTDRQINNRIDKLQDIEALMEELEAQAEAIRAELKADLESKGEDEHNTGSFIIRWKEINANLKMSVFAEKECHFSPDSIQVYTALTTTSLVNLKPVKP